MQQLWRIRKSFLLRNFLDICQTVRQSNFLLRNDEIFLLLFLSHAVCDSVDFQVEGRRAQMASDYTRSDVIVKIRPHKWIFAHTWRPGDPPVPSPDDVSEILVEIFGRNVDYWSWLTDGYIVNFLTIGLAKAALRLHGACLGNTSMGMFVEPLDVDELPKGKKHYMKI
jgi:hypothetical protein